MSAELCGALNEADLMVQLRPPEADALHGPPPSSLYLGAPRSPSQVTFSTAGDFTFLGGSRGEDLGGFPGVPDANRLLSSA